MAYMSLQIDRLHCGVCALPNAATAADRRPAATAGGRGATVAVCDARQDAVVTAESTQPAWKSGVLRLRQ